MSWEEDFLEVSGSCKFTAVKYSQYDDVEVSMDYIEYSAGHYHTDSETSVEIDKDKAAEIVGFLSKHFNLEVQS